jgi:hypothetical protein
MNRRVVRMREKGIEKECIEEMFWWVECLEEE